MPIVSAMIVDFSFLCIRHNRAFQFCREAFLVDLHVPVKENSTEEARGRVGGQNKGHVGHGRAGVPAPDEEIDLPKPTCPASHAQLAHFQVRTRTVVHMVPARRVVKRYSVYRAWCPECGCYHESEVPGVMPHFAFSNDLIAQVLVDHFGNEIEGAELVNRVVLIE